MSQRGLFIVFEGIDKCGKSTQAEFLGKYLKIFHGYDCETISFPNRLSRTGLILHNFLTIKIDMNIHATHLIFSANRWELANSMIQKLMTGTNLIVDRYAYSGFAYSDPKLELEWCKSSDRGLPKPDIVFYLDINMEDIKKRSNFFNFIHFFL